MPCERDDPGPGRVSPACKSGQSPMVVGESQRFSKKGTVRTRRFTESRCPSGVESRGDWMRLGPGQSRPVFPVSLSGEEKKRISPLRQNSISGVHGIFGRPVASRRICGPCGLRSGGCTEWVFWYTRTICRVLDRGGVPSWEPPLGGEILPPASR